MFSADVWQRIRAAAQGSLRLFPSPPGFGGFAGGIGALLGGHFLGAGFAGVAGDFGGLGFGEGRGAGFTAEGGDFSTAAG